MNSPTVGSSRAVSTIGLLDSYPVFCHWDLLQMFIQQIRRTAPDLNLSDIYRFVTVSAGPYCCCGWIVELAVHLQNSGGWIESVISRGTGILIQNQVLTEPRLGVGVT